MKIQAYYFLAALVLLLPPMPLAADVCRVASRSLRGNPANPACAALLWQNWVDLFRAMLGVVILTRLAISADPAVPGGELRVLVCVGVLLGIAVLLQAIRLGTHIQLIAPVFYLCGLTLVLPGYAEGAFAVGVGWLFAVGGKNLEYQMPVMAVGLLAVVFALGHTFYLLLNCALILLPLVIAILFLKRSHFAVRNLETGPDTLPVKQTLVLR
jgi:hypothetical protein